MSAAVIQGRRQEPALLKSLSVGKRPQRARSPRETLASAAPLDIDRVAGPSDPMCGDVPLAPPRGGRATRRRRGSVEVAARSAEQAVFVLEDLLG